MSTPFFDLCISFNKSFNASSLAESPFFASTSLLIFILSIVKAKAKIVKKTANINATTHEVLKVLRTAEKYVESTQYDMARSSDVCNYFRSQNMRAEDVAEEIELLNSHLTKLGIELFNDGIDWDDKLFVESYDICNYFL